jgi:hypothetical protein
MRAVRFVSRSCLPILLWVGAAAQADERWSLEVLVGDAYNFDSRTHIEHDGLGELRFDGEFETHGLEGPLHYAWRVARWRGDRAWELQLLHHKLYLQNLPPGIEALSISHGFNIITLNRAFELDHWRVRVGAGPVVAHPEARIGNSSYNGPYELGGAAALFGIGRWLQLSSHWSLGAEASLTFGYVDVRPSGSPKVELSVRNPAVHAQVGLSYGF